jgi:hypothetical protein
VRAKLYQAQQSPIQVVKTLAESKYQALQHSMSMTKVHFFIKSMWKTPLLWTCTSLFLHLYRLIYGVFHVNDPVSAYWNIWLVDETADENPPPMMPLPKQLTAYPPTLHTKLLMVAGSHETFLCIRDMLDHWITDTATKSYVSASHHVGVKGRVHHPDSYRVVGSTTSPSHWVEEEKDEEEAKKEGKLGREWSELPTTRSVLQRAITIWATDPHCPFLLVDLSDEDQLGRCFTQISAGECHILWLDVMHPDRISDIVQQWFPARPCPESSQMMEWSQKPQWTDAELRRLHKKVGEKKKKETAPKRKQHHKAVGKSKEELPLEVFFLPFLQWNVVSTSQQSCFFLS